MKIDSFRTEADFEAYLAAYFERISQPIELIASLDDSEGAQQIRELVTEVAAVAPPETIHGCSKRTNYQPIAPTIPRIK